MALCENLLCFLEALFAPKLEQNGQVFDKARQCKPIFYLNKTSKLLHRDILTFAL